MYSRLAKVSSSTPILSRTTYFPYHCGSAEQMKKKYPADIQPLKQRLQVILKLHHLFIPNQIEMQCLKTHKLRYFNASPPTPPMFVPTSITLLIIPCLHPPSRGRHRQGSPGCPVAAVPVLVPVFPHRHFVRDPVASFAATTRGTPRTL